MLEDKKKLEEIIAKADLASKEAKKKKPFTLTVEEVDTARRSFKHLKGWLGTNLGHKVKIFHALLCLEHLEDKECYTMGIQRLQGILSCLVLIPSNVKLYLQTLIAGIYEQAVKVSKTLQLFGETER